MDPLLAWRKEFPILAHTTYMISHSLGAMPRRASDRLLEFADTWATRGIRAWQEGWWEMPVTVGDLVGSIVGAGKGEVVMHQNVSTCQWIVADLYQSAGILPVDVRTLNSDFATGGSIKWLCGGPGAGYLYVRRDLWSKLEPAATGWQAHREPFAFAEGPVDFADNAMPFLNGTSNVPALYSARSGYEIINEIGVAPIRAK